MSKSKKDFHLSRAEKITASRTSRIDNHGEGDALLALYHLLDERLPQKPMQVIPTPGASLGGVEDTDETLARAIPPMGGSGAILYVGKVNGGVQFVIHNNPAKVSAADARALAYAILRTV